jgi:ABC-type antimicrobial peptide transport system permease subunit
VGLVKNTKYLWLQEDFRPIVFLPSFQDPNPDSTAQVMLRSDLAPADARSAVKRTLSEVSPEIAIEFDSLRNVVQDSLLRERLLATLAGFFGLLGVLLAAIGLYGVISYMVAQRTNEIGIRMALGAQRAGVIRMILRDVLTTVLLGLAAGVPGALLASKLVSSFLYGIKPNDPLALAAAVGILLCAVLLAGYAPARRASRIEPMAALRHE